MKPTPLWKPFKKQDKHTQQEIIKGSIGDLKMETSPAASTASAASERKRMTRGKPTPCCSKIGLKRGPWTPEEDEILASYIRRAGEGKWRTLPKRAGLLRCGKSCRLRWMNYLKPSVKRGHIAPDEEDLILRLHRLLGNRWSLIAGRIPGRTDNEIKNYWNTHLSKKLISNGIDPTTHKPLNPRHCLSYNTTNTNPNSDRANATDPPPKSATAVASSVTDGVVAVDQEGIDCSTGILGNSSVPPFGLNEYAGSMGFLPDEQFSSFLDPFIGGDEMFFQGVGQLPFQCDGSQVEEPPGYCKSYYGSTSNGALAEYETFGNLWEAADGDGPINQSGFMNPANDVGDN